MCEILQFECVSFNNYSSSTVAPLVCKRTDYYLSMDTVIALSIAAMLQLIVCCDTQECWSLFAPCNVLPPCVIEQSCDGILQCDWACTPHCDSAAQQTDIGSQWVGIKYGPDQTSI